MKKTGRILVVDDDTDVLNAARLYLKQHVEKVDVESNPKLIPSLMKEYDYDAILLDMNFHEDVSSGEEGFYWLEKILEIDPAMAVVLITAYGDVEKAVLAVKTGASDFVLKPWQNEKLLATVTSAMNLSQSKRDSQKLRTQNAALKADMEQPYQNIIGKSRAMEQVFQTIEKVAKTDANVLITGENGTGKELVARALHRRSNRSENAFITVDMGALPEGLFESELFGHEKGAFTDAKESRAGRFEIAHGGTLFLDEVGNIPLQLQPKLLSALQTHEIRRIGSNKTTKIDIRLICATNESLGEMVEKQEFRQDLLYRINTIEIKLPPLWERTEDIPLLAEHFLKQYRSKYKKEIKGITDQALNHLKEYHWPGNIRELEHAVERAVIMTDEEQLQKGDFLLTSVSGNDHKLPVSGLNLEEVEKTVIRKAMDKHGGNISHAAEELGLTRASLYRRLEKYGL
ncbi:sigma-54-dependent transcriptional regulator [Gracilimonas sediminicola]|uniref:Sigma-54 dependent transcriptional regulator n=1 Tax=Gracilimonas sediminicola TaxID=2952158 RepID=A0A9X2RE95_9BACT|nr:sigma-54 dependent transcriptional regulator [Gracilimonas sediminicola]MCP9291790.1 sigma-54 dependent transcriptional regulator [Gracilimonas sediminicola]